MYALAFHSQLDLAFLQAEFKGGGKEGAGIDDGHISIIEIAQLQMLPGLII